MRLRPVLLFAALSSLFAGSARAMTDAELAAIVEKRLHGDRTGACFAAAVIEDARVSRAYVCADGKDPTHRIGPDTAFEIGSVSKPMMAALLAGLVREGKASLDDPLSAYLPEGTAIPAYGEKEILLRHIVTHTSGLPSVPAGIDDDPQNPYAGVAEADLLGALSTIELTDTPGSKFEYSNFAAMLLSYAIARRADSDFETLLGDRVFAPLGMRSSYIDRRPEHVRAAIGHAPDGKSTSAWTFRPQFAGVGGVRSTLGDMVRYVQGQFGGAAEPLGTDFRATHAAIANDAEAKIAMFWMRAPLNGRMFLAHEGGTGGFSSFVAFDPTRRFGVVILSDTGLHTLGGLGSLGLHLLDPRVPLGKPLPAETPIDRGPAPTLSADEAKAYVGDYPLAPDFVLTIRAEGAALTAQATGQGAFALTPKAEDIFAFADADIVIRFRRDAAGKVVALTLEQYGNQRVGRRK